MLLDIVTPIKKILQLEQSQESISSAFQTSRAIPLGKTKLRARELLCSLDSLKKPEIIKTVTESSVVQTLLQLIAKHPWNNMIQLQTQQIFDDVFASEASKEEKQEFL